LKIAHLVAFSPPVVDTRFRHAVGLPVRGRFFLPGEGKPLFIHAPFVSRLFVAATIGLLLSLPTAQALEFEWDGGAGNNLWDGIDTSMGVVTNWSPENFPLATDNILLSSSSLAGPVTIDLNGNRAVDNIDADGVDGTYTFINNALTIHKLSGEAIITRNGSGLAFESDLLLNAAGTLRLNVQESGGIITVNGNVASAALAGTTTLMPTVVNTSLPVGVEIAGDISDGTAQIALSSGFNGNTAHTGTVRVTGNNTYTGGTRVYIGALEFDSIANIGGAANALGQPASGDSTIRLGTTASGSSTATLRYIGSGHTSNRVIELAGKDNDSARIESSGSGALVLTGGVINPANGETLFLGGDNTDDNILAGAIEGGNASDITSLRKEGTGKWILSGASPTLDGIIIAAEGELVLTGSIGTTAANAGSFQTNNAGEFTLDGGYMAVSNFSKSLNGVINFNSGTVRVTAASNSSTYTGALDIGTTGPGTLQLQGGSKTFEDVTLQGVDDSLEIGGSGTWQFDNLDNSAGGTLTGGSSATVQINGGVFTYRQDAGEVQFNSLLTGLGGFTKQGAGTVTFATTPAQHTYAGTTRIEEGTLKLTGSPGLPDSSPVFMDASGTLDITSATGGDGLGRLSGTGRVLTGLNAGVSIGTNGQSANFGGQISGAGGFIKRDLGTQTLSGANTYTGATTINAGGGTLEIASGGSIVGTSNISLSTATLSVTGGTIDTPGNIRPVSNSAVFNISGGLVKANAIDRTVNSQYLHQFNWTGGTVHLLSATAITGSTGTAIHRPFGPSLNLSSGKALIVDASLSVTGVGLLSINGGSVTADTIVTGGNIAFNSGSMRLRDDQTFDTARLNGLGANSPLVANKSLAVDGVATIAAPLVVAGGTFSAGTIVNPENLILDSGTLEVTGGDLDIATGTSFDTTSGMTVNVTSGALNVAAGAELNGINTTINTTAGINNSGDVNLINSTVNGGLVNGTGGSANLLGSNTFGGDLLLTSSSNLFIDIGGTAAGEFDMINVFGNSTATLDGLLNVSLAGGFTPTAGQQFTVLTAAAVTDNGLTLAGPAADLFSMTIGSTSVILEALHQLVLFGDADNNLSVSGSDLLAVTNNFGNTGPADGLLLGDADDNGSVSGSDLLAVTNNFGATLPGSLASVPVPEPRAAAVLLLGTALLPFRCRTQQRNG